jgi:hypothetical protein
MASAPPARKTRRPIREGADRRRHHEDDEAGEHTADEALRLRHLERLHHVGGHVVEQHVGAHGPEDHHQEAGDRAARIQPQDLGQGRARFLLGGEIGRFIHMLANVIADRPDQQADQERHAPAPALQRLRAERARDERADARARQHRKADARLDQTRVETALMPRHVFHQERRRIAHLAAGGKTLQQPSEQHDERTAHADLRVRGREADQPDAERHQADGERHRLLAPHAVAIDAEDDATHRPHEEADAKGGRGQQHGREIIRRGEEQLRDDHREEPVAGEIEHFQRGADQRGDDRAPPLHCIDRRDTGHDRFIGTRCFHGRIPEERVAPKLERVSGLR